MRQTEGTQFSRKIIKKELNNIIFYIFCRKLQCLKKSETISPNLFPPPLCRHAASPPIWQTRMPAWKVEKNVVVAAVWCHRESPPLFLAGLTFSFWAGALRACVVRIPPPPPPPFHPRLYNRWKRRKTCLALKMERERVGPTRSSRIAPKFTRWQHGPRGWCRKTDSEHVFRVWRSSALSTCGSWDTRCILRLKTSLQAVKLCRIFCSEMTPLFAGDPFQDKILVKIKCTITANAMAKISF